MEWLRWIITIAVIAGAGYLGRDYGRTEMLAEARKQALDERDQANAELRQVRRVPRRGSDRAP